MELTQHSEVGGMGQHGQGKIRVHESFIGFIFLVFLLLLLKILLFY